MLSGEKLPSEHDLCARAQNLSWGVKKSFFFFFLLKFQFADQFKELREAARLAREKSQERFELANPALSIAAPEVKTHTQSVLYTYNYIKYKAHKGKLHSSLSVGDIPASQS